MKTIAIEGIIGWDVVASSFRKRLESAKGEDVDLIINSPGGSVWEALAIYNAIRDFRRDGGKITARVIGLAASAATYVALAADPVTIEDNAVWMVHNPWFFTLGDQNQLRKDADILEGLANLIAAAYARKTGKPAAEMHALMDDTTWLYGEEIVEAGFADSVVPAGDGAETKAQALSIAHLAMEAMKKRVTEEPEIIDREEIAALLPDGISMHENPARAVVDSEPEKITPAVEAGHREVPMDREQLKKEHPDLFDALRVEFEEAGVKRERARVAELRAYIEADPDNTKLSTVIGEAVAGGQTAQEITAKIHVAIRDGKALNGENPPAVRTAEESMDGLTAEDIEAAKIAGMSLADYRKFSKEGE